MQEYDRQLTLCQEENIQFKLVEDPFSIDPEEVPTQLQLEVIELQAWRLCARLNVVKAAGSTSTEV